MDFFPGLWTAFKVLYLYVQKIIFPTYFSSDYSYNQIIAVNNLFNSWQAMTGIADGTGTDSRLMIMLVLVTVAVTSFPTLLTMLAVDVAVAVRIFPTLLVNVEVVVTVAVSACGFSVPPSSGWVMTLGR